MVLLPNQPVKGMQEPEKSEKVTAKLTAILPDKPLSRTINPNSGNEGKAASGRGRPLGATGEGGWRRAKKSAIVRQE
jgi:hypothetical protein